MELDNYRNFLAIIEAGSFTGAADYVHIAQPALSKQLRSLENYFGTKLIITTRGSRQILLTEAGRVLYQKAKYMWPKAKLLISWVALSVRCALALLIRAAPFL